MNAHASLLGGGRGKRAENEQMALEIPPHMFRPSIRRGNLLAVRCASRRVMTSDRPTSRVIGGGLGLLAARLPRLHLQLVMAARGSGVVPAQLRRQQTDIG